MKAGPVKRLAVIADSLPADTNYVRHGTDAEGALWLIVTSESFAEVEPGHPVVVLRPPTFRDLGWETQDAAHRIARGFKTNPEYDAADVREELERL